MKRTNPWCFWDVCMQEYRAQFLTQTLQSLNLDQVIYAGRPSKSVEDMYVPLQLD